MRKISLFRPALAFGALLLASPLYAQQNGPRDPLGRYGTSSAPAVTSRGYTRQPSPSPRRPAVAVRRPAMRAVHDYYPDMRRGQGPNYNVPTLRHGHLGVPGRPGLMGR